MRDFREVQMNERAEGCPAPRAQVKARTSLDTVGGPAYDCRPHSHAARTPNAGMQLLVAVINHEEKLDDILAGFVELGITGATIVGSEGMGHVLSHDVPIFAGLRSLTERSRPTNQTLFSVLDDAKLDAAIALIQEVCGSLTEPGKGIVFTVPVSRVIGLAPELESDA
jgi:nitrogen regulatory protein P-II 1